MKTRIFNRLLYKNVTLHPLINKVFYSSTVHTLKVAEQIKKRRAEALLGGGLKRIDAQHKKVNVLN